MNTNERDARRRRQRELRRKQVQKRLIMFVCAASAVLVVLVLILVLTDPGRADNSKANSEKQSGTLSSQEEKNSSGTKVNTGPVAPVAVNSELTPAATVQPVQTNGTGQTSQTGLYDPEAGNVTPEELPAKVAETAAKIPECYTGELLPAATAVYTDRSADFAVQPGVPCGADPVEGEKVVYLTLDDGPSANTITALNILDHYGIKATFFVTGLNPDYFYLIKEAYDRGHTIGLHTFTHDYEYVYSSVENYYNDLNQIGQVVSNEIGYVPCFIRFPGGAANYISHDYSEGIMTFLTQDVGQYGYQYFDWNASSGDGAETTDPALLADAAISYNYYDTIVMLSHDGSTKEPTMQALPFIIEYYLSKGYEFRPLTRNSYTSHHSVEN